MRIEYDPNLIEQAVLLAVRQDPERERALHAVIDPLYAMPDGRARDSRFNEAYAAFFARLRLDSVMSALVAEPGWGSLIQECVNLCIVCKAPRGKDESAELLVRQGEGPTASADRTLVIQVCPESLLDGDSFTLRMRREFLHVADMLDGDFGYCREAIDALPARQNLIRDRYRVLWDIYVEARLHRRGLGDEPTTKRLAAMLRRAFAIDDGGTARNAFDRVFCATRLTHPQLLGWARSPETLISKTASSQPATRQVPGQACPLCGFPTHDWFCFEGDAADRLADVIRLAHATWQTENGACRQCAELHVAGAAD